MAATKGLAATDETVSTRATVQRRPVREEKREPRRQPRYHVVLWDDDEHTYDYVVRMMAQLFGHTAEKGFLIATQVDTAGKAICLTTTREHAELKRDQIHAFGRDELMSNCRGSMRASIEPVPE